MEKTVENVKHLALFSPKVGGGKYNFPPFYTPIVENKCGKVGDLVENYKIDDFFIIFLHNDEKTRKNYYFL